MKTTIYNVVIRDEDGVAIVSYTTSDEANKAAEVAAHLGAKNIAEDRGIPADELSVVFNDAETYPTWVIAHFEEGNVGLVEVVPSELKGV